MTQSFLERLRASQVARELAERERREHHMKARHVPLPGDGDEVLDYLSIPADTGSTSFQMLPEDFFVRCVWEECEPHGVVLLGQGPAIMRRESHEDYRRGQLHLERCMAALDWVPHRGVWACARCPWKPVAPGTGVIDHGNPGP